MAKKLNNLYTHIAINSDRAYCSSDDNADDETFWTAVPPDEVDPHKTISYCPECVENAWKDIQLKYDDILDLVTRFEEVQFVRKNFDLTNRENEDA